MYLPPYHRLSDPRVLHALVGAHPLGAWVCHGAEGLLANHIPFFLDRDRGPLGTLVGHVARANPVWRALGPAVPSVVMFQGPQAYITPTWYPSHVEHGRVVPTWNYQVAHVHGVARAVHDAAWLLQMLDRLTQAQENGQARPWRVADPPEDFTARLLAGIVGIELLITRLEGKCKASQDEALADRQGTVQGLRAQPGDAAQAMAALVAQALRDEGGAGP